MVGRFYGDRAGALGLKTTIIVDEELWNRIRQSILPRSASSKNLSKTVEEALRMFDAEGMLFKLARRLGIEIEGYPSSSEIRRGRPKVGIGVADTVREMRESREKSLSGLERSCEEVR